MRILLADDHPMIRTALETLLRGTKFEIVGQAGSGSEAIDAVLSLAPQILLLDVRMPNGSGIEVLRRLRESGSAVKVILVTAGIADGALTDALRLDVNGIVLKNSDPALLLECLEAVSEGEMWIDPDLKERAEEARNRASSRAALSPREKQLVALVAKGLRNRDIAERIGVTEGTVKVYLHTLFDKVGVANRTELAMRADDFISREY